MATGSHVLEQSIRVKQQEPAANPALSVLDGPMLLSNRQSLATSHRNSWSVETSTPGSTARTLRPFLHVARAFPAEITRGWQHENRPEDKGLFHAVTLPGRSNLVEDTRFELVTSCMPCKRSPN